MTLRLLNIPGPGRESRIPAGSESEGFSLSFSFNALMPKIQTALIYLYQTPFIRNTFVIV